MPRQQNNTIFKRFCVTLNNPSEEEYAAARNFASNSCRYAIIGREVAPTTSTPHLQCFFNLLRARRFGSIKKILGHRIHIERSNGSDVDNQKYCSKGGDFWEHGSPQGQGKRNDLISIVEEIKSGTGLVEICENHTESFIRYHSGIEKAYRYIGRGCNDRNWKTKVFTPQTSWGASLMFF